MDKIQIVNFLLTRKCNLHCDYCRISRNYDRPGEYPDLNYYLKNEIPKNEVLSFLEKLKKHNPDIFVIFYGGEPLFRKDLPDIINYCNKETINYTIITNNSKEVQPLLKNLFDKTEYIMGLTSSVDPVIFNETFNKNNDIYKKSHEGLNNLIKYKEKVKDLVAEITVTNDTIEYLEKLVKELTKNNISSSITFIDISKSRYYDFSNIMDEKLLIKSSEKVIKILDDLYLDESLDIHMRDQLKIFPSILPSNMDCKTDENIFNITIDSDGSLRLCLRIRGIITPEFITIKNIFNPDYTLNLLLKDSLSKDKSSLCKLCNWTCMIHSKLAIDGNIKELLHSNKRSE